MTMWGTFLKPMHPEGYRFVGIFAAVTLVLFLVWAPLGWLGLGLTIWCYYFFRDPPRTVPAALAFFTGASQFESPTGAISAAAIIVTIPIVILVLAFQRQIVAGLTNGAVKG